MSSFFSLPFLLSLAITLLIVGFVSTFFIQRLREQNHKMSSMLDLVSVLAQEVAQIRSHLSQDITITKLARTSDLIDVSDGEQTSDDDDDDEEEDDKDDDESESGSDGDDADSVIDFEMDEIDEEDIKISENVNDTIVTTDEPLEDIAHFDKMYSATEEVKIIHLLPHEEEDGDETHNNFLGDLQPKNEEFRKMSISKLRQIVAEKLPTVDTSKLKKFELVLLLTTV